MSPAVLALAVQAFQALLAEAPQIEGLATDIKNFFQNLFNKGLISSAQQNQVHAHVDSVCAAILAGQEPPEFKVEADPS